MRVQQTSVSLDIAKKKEQELLDHFAGLAMQGFVSSHPGNEYPNTEIISKKSYEMAKAMLKARKEANNG